MSKGNGLLISALIFLLIANFSMAQVWNPELGDPPVPPQMDESLLPSGQEQGSFDPSDPLDARMVGLESKSFPFIYLNVEVDTFGVGFPDLDDPDFEVYENGILQTDYFQVDPPDNTDCGQLADFVFVIDVSTSMGEEIAAVKANIVNFINNLAASGIDYRVGVVVFANCVYTYNSGNFYTDPTTITSIINGLSFDEHGTGCSNYKIPEDGFDALAAAAGMNFRPGAQRVAILLTDAPAHYAYDYNDYYSQNEGNLTYHTLGSITELLNNNNIICHVVGPIYSTYCGLGWTYGEFLTAYPNYGGQYNAPGSLDMATGGNFYPVGTNFNSILDDIVQTVCNSYKIRYKSSEPNCDGIEREVVVDVSYDGDLASDNGSYIPCSAPYIHRTQPTIDLHDQSWAVGTSFLIEVEAIDNVEPYIDDVVLWYRTTGVASYASMTMASLPDNIFQATIPSIYAQPPGVDYYITGTDGQSLVSDPSVNPQDNPYQLAVIPNEAPKIVHYPPEGYIPGEAINIEAVIIDTTEQLETARLYYRRVGEPQYQMIDMENVSEDNFAGLIPAEYVTCEGVQYYLRASDNFGVNGYYGTPDNPVELIIEPPLIACPETPVPALFDASGIVCVSLPISGYDEVTVDGAEWSDNTLCFTAYQSGLYEFSVTASNVCHETTCDITVNAVVSDTCRARISPDLVYKFYQFAVEPMDVTIHLGNLEEGHSVEDINPETVRINDVLTPAEMNILDSYPGYDGKVMEMVLPMTDFITSYPLMWDSTMHTYIVTGQYLVKCDPFIEGCEVMMRGHISGDVNVDDMVNIMDIMSLVDFLYNNGPRPRPMLEAADVNSSGAVNILDLNLLVRYVLANGPKPACPQTNY